MVGDQPGKNIRVKRNPPVKREEKNYRDLPGKTDGLRLTPSQNIWDDIHPEGTVGSRSVFRFFRLG